MSVAQTEARAIVAIMNVAFRTAKQYDAAIEVLATAIAAKDAARDEAVFLKDCAEAALVKRESELVAKNAELAAAHQRYVDANEARIDAEAALAEARKALEQAEQQLDYGQVDAAHRIIFRAARRAREQGGE